MAKNVFKPQEIMYLSRKVFIEPPKIVTEEPVEEVEAVEETRGGEFTGPTVEDVRREAERFRKDWEKEKERLMTQAQADAEKIGAALGKKFPGTEVGVFRVLCQLGRGDL